MSAETPDRARKGRAPPSAPSEGDGSATKKSRAASEKAPEAEVTFALPGFNEIGGGVVRDRSGHVAFDESVARVSALIPKFLKATPQYHYELLSQAFGCRAELKLENLQMFGDIYARNSLGVILGNYFNQKDSIGHGVSEVLGLVIVLDPSQSALHLALDGIVLTALHVKLKAVIYVAPGEMSVLHCTQLHSCHDKGAKVIFHKGDSASCYERAKQHAVDMHLIYIDQRFTPQFSLLGAATVAQEMIAQSPDCGTIVIPLRLFGVGWSYISGISLLMKKLKPDVKIIVVQMNEDLLRANEGLEYERHSLFPDLLEIGWMALVTEQADLRLVFDSIDAQNVGKIKTADLQAMLVNMGADSKRFVAEHLPTTTSVTEFIRIVSRQRTDLIAEGVKIPILADLYSALSLESLIQTKLVDELVKVTEDQAALAFIRCLEYTHTLTNGKGAVALAALWSGMITPKKDEKLIVMIMGGFVDVIDFQNILDYGLGLTGQSFDMQLDLPDNTTALSKVLQVIASHKVSVYDISVDRNVEEMRQYHVRTIIQCRSKNFEQQKQVAETLKAQGITCDITTTPSPYDAKRVAEAMTAVPSTTPIESASSSSSSSSSASNDHPAPRKMSDVTVHTIRQAYARIRGNLSVTPIYLSQVYSKISGCKLYLMLENIQKVGSFKIRGSSNMVLKTVESSSTKPKGLIAASAGNHAQGVALVSAKVGLPCTIVCPEYAPETKLQWTRMYGAEVIKKGNSLEEAGKYAEQLCEQRKWMMVRPYNDVDVIEGQGTMGLEIYESIPDVDTVVVNVGGGGMIAGIALYLKGVNPNIRIVGVQSQNVAPLADFKQTHELRYIEPAALTLADGTNVKRPGGVHTNILQDYVDEYVTVSENEIASTIVHLMTNSRTISEGAGCLGLAALLHRKIAVRKDEKVCVVICGGNIDMSTLRQVYEYGLRALGRCFTIHITTWDYPGNLSKIIALAARAELTVREIRHIRGGGDINWNEVTLSIAFYSHSFNHQVFFLNLLVEDALFPEVVGRDYIKDHESVYQAFDKAVESKRIALANTAKERRDVFIAQYREQQQASASTVL